MLFDIVNKILNETQTKKLHLFQTQNRNTETFFLQKDARAKKVQIHFFGIYESPKDTNSIFLQAKNTQTCTNSKC